MKCLKLGRVEKKGYQMDSYKIKINIDKEYKRWFENRGD